MALRSTYNTGESTVLAFYGDPRNNAGRGYVHRWSVSASASSQLRLLARLLRRRFHLAQLHRAEIIKDGAVTANVLSVVTSSAIEYVRNDGFRAGYGLNTYGSYIYGENYSVEDGVATASISVTPTVSYQVVRQVTATPAVTVTPSAQGFMSIVGAVSDTVSITPNIEYNRVRLFSASDDILGDTVVSARYKWLPATDPTTTWTTSDYLERAA